MLNNKSLVQIKNNQIITNSLLVADKFGKRHDLILRSIKCLKEKFGALNFAESDFYIKEVKYINSQNKEQPAFEFNKDFFTLLVMGFTGEKALKFKIDYINAFNKMEQALLNKAENKIEEKKEEDNEISFYFQNKFYNNDKEQKYIINDPMLCKNYFGYKIINDRPMLKLVDIADIINKPTLMVREYVGLDYVYSNLLDRNKTKDKLFAYYLHKFRMEFMFIKNNNLFEKDDDDKEISFTEMKLLGERLKSATECAQILGTTPQMFGKITNKLNLKTSEYGEYFKEKLKNGKDCQVFKYKENVLKKVQEYLFY